MEDRTQKLAAKNNDVEKRLTERLSAIERDKSSPLIAPILQVAGILKEYRATSEDVVLHALPFARSNEVESRLWMTHSRMNNLFRKQLFKLRKESAGKHVEIRQFIRQYLEFLKDAQRFYRDLVRKLNSRFGPIPELQQVAQYSQSSAQNQSSASPEIRHECLLSCHQTLIYLGDLSRYRTTEKLDKDPTWGPAIGYYNLAAILRPSSGLAFHQQSIIAFEEADHFRATYYLYRAIAVEEPHPKAIDNLELEFKKARKAWDSGDLRPRFNPQDRAGSRKALLAWFVRLHSLCFLGQDFPGHDQLENEIRSHLIAEIKDQATDGVLSKIAFVNIAAQYTAANRFQKSPDHTEHIRAFYSFLRLNLNTFISLLTTLCSQLNEYAGEQIADTDPLHSLGKRLDHTSRHSLPALRIYSAWLLTNSNFLVPGIGDEGLKELIVRFWKTYTESLTQLAAVFPAQFLPANVAYLLEEDSDFLGFQPLKSERSKKLWLDSSSGQQKVKPDQADRHSEDYEMLARVRELLVDGLLLAVDPALPVDFDGVTYTAKTIGESQTEVQAQISPLRRPQDHVAPVNNSVNATLPNDQRFQASEFSSAKTDDQDDELSRMVDDLVGPEEDVPKPWASVSGLGPLAPAFQPSRSPSVSRIQRLHSVSSLWDDTQSMPHSPTTDHGSRPHRTPPSATARARQIHSRIGSTNSLSSQSPLQNSGVPSSFVPTPPVAPQTQYATTEANTSFNGCYTSGLDSPLLFGASGSVWSTKQPRRSVAGYTPPNGQGG